LADVLSFAFSGPAFAADGVTWEGSSTDPLSEHQELAAAFAKSSPALRAAFDDYLRTIRTDGSYDKLVNRYYPGIRRYFPAFFARSQ
jgi:ABC-type amino acid transport substrate-binding protein